MPDLIYQQKPARYEIDACLPQLSALEKGKIQLCAFSHGQYPGVTIEGDLLKGISSMGYLDAVDEQDWGMENHRNEGIEICFQESGENQMIVDGKSYKVPAKTVTITRPWQLHRVGDPHVRPGRLHWIIIDVGVRRPNQKWKWPDWCLLTQSDLKELTQLLRGNEHPVWKAGVEIEAIFKKLAHYVYSGDAERYVSQLMIVINQLLIELLELLRSQHIKPDNELSTLAHTVELFLNELRENPKMFQVAWTLDDMAAHCGIGRSAFTKYCYQIQNTSPVDFLNRCRLQHAAQRLRDEPDSSITAIAFDLGFSSSQYFTRVFKNLYKCTPSEWRERATV
ncbi:MAG: helix-turn-helix transcriptional regulator [Lentimonas sp.]